MTPREQFSDAVYTIYAAKRLMDEGYLLREEGIEAESITVCKNGCECLGIRVINPDNPNYHRLFIIRQTIRWRLL